MVSAISLNRIELKAGESLSVEPGAMLAYSNCEMRTGLAAGGIFQKARMFVLGGESLIQNQFTAKEGGGWVALEEHMPGQIMKKSLSPGESPLMIRRSALIAATPNINLDAKYLGLSGYFKGQGISMLCAKGEKGNGDVYFHTTEGVVRSFRVRAHEGPVFVDNNMILAYSDSLDATVTAAGQNTTSYLFSGEGLVTKFEGDGIVYVGSAEPKYQPSYARAQNQ